MPKNFFSNVSILDFIKNHTLNTPRGEKENSVFKCHPDKLEGIVVQRINQSYLSECWDRVPSYREDMPMGRRGLSLVWGGRI